MNIQKQNDLKSISKANEEWIEVFGGRYAVSNLGRVVSFYFKDKYRIKEMVQRKSAGYLRVHLHILGRSKLVSVHRLVAMAFVPNISNLPEVNHINGDKEDNQSTNLEWVTKSQNKLHSIYVLKREHPMLGKRLYDSYIHRGVIQYSLDGMFIKSYHSIRVAEHETGIEETNISRCANGKRKTAGGYIWKFKE